mgnify:CR=1 FL=1
MDKNRGNKMTVKLVSNEKIAETSSKGNQEKWFDKEANKWYKLDQFGYEALAETLISRLLEKSNINSDTPFSFAKYQMERLNVHGRDRTGCSSESFLKSGQSIITLSHLFSRHLGISLKASRCFVTLFSLHYTGKSATQNRHNGKTFHIPRKNLRFSCIIYPSRGSAAVVISAQEYCIIYSP